MSADSELAVTGEGVTAPQGFEAAGVAVGLKSTGKPDVAVVVNRGPLAVGAAVFTINRAKANPILWSQQAIADGVVGAIVLNSGGANCFTGSFGFQTTHQTAEKAAELLGISPGDVLVCSTGLIGTGDETFRAKVLTGTEDAISQLSADGGESAARAIMTTDTVPKQVALHHPHGWNIGGMAKGAGMMAPSLATMLCVLTTDARASAEQLDLALRRATSKTFDRLDIDGSTSTNDTVLLLSSGASQIPVDQTELDAAVLAVCDDLAAQLMADAEGVTKRIVITVTGAATEDDAIAVARTIARDSLVKTALFGSDANWGRVLAAAGIAPVTIDPDRIAVSFNGQAVCVNGTGVDGARDVDLSGPEVAVLVDLGLGVESGSIRTTDLSHAYVEENSAYSS